MNARLFTVSIGSIAAGVMLAFLVTDRNASKALPGSSTPGSSAAATGGSPQASAAQAAQPHSRSRLAPPKLVVAPTISTTPKAVENDSQAADYDPVVLFNADPQPLRALFAAEKRDEGWATRMEQHLTSLLRAQLEGLGTSARLPAVECRTMMCNVVVSADSKVDLDSALGFLGRTRLGNVQASELPLGDREAAFSAGYVLAWHPDQRLTVLNETNKSTRIH